MYRRLEFYFETSPLKTRLYFSVWCTNLSRVRQEMSNSKHFKPRNMKHIQEGMTFDRKILKQESKCAIFDQRLSDRLVLSPLVQFQSTSQILKVCSKSCITANFATDLMKGCKMQDLPLNIRGSNIINYKFIPCT